MRQSVSQQPFLRGMAASPPLFLLDLLGGGIEGEEAMPPLVAAEEKGQREIRWSGVSEKMRFPRQAASETVTPQNTTEFRD